MKSLQYVYWTIQELLIRLKELSKKGHLTADEKEEKREIERELKARGERNRAKRNGYVHSHFSIYPSTSTTISTPSINGDNDIYVSIPSINIDNTLVATGSLLVVSGLIMYVIANDSTGIGLVDDLALLVLVPLFFILGGEL